MILVTVHCCSAVFLIDGRLPPLQTFISKVWNSRESITNWETDNFEVACIQDSVASFLKTGKRWWWVWSSSKTRRLKTGTVYIESTASHSELGPIPKLCFHMNHLSSLSLLCRLINERMKYHFVPLCAFPSSRNPLLSYCKFLNTNTEYLAYKSTGKRC